MIRLFDIVGGKVKESEHCYTLQFLKTIMDEFPDDYIKVYCYLFYMTCPNPDLNPYFHFTEEDKSDIIVKDLDIDFSLDEFCIAEALLRCRQMYETETSRAYYAMKTALDNISLYLTNTKITHGRDGNITAIISMTSKFDAIRQSYAGVYKELIEEQKSSVRGGKNLAYDDK